MKVMFVCSANTCRSAMAEAIFKTMVNENVEVYSAGIHAETGKSASKNTVEVCKHHGLEVSKHKSTNISDSNINDMNLILTATWAHKKQLKKMMHEKNIYTIKEYAGLYPPDIKDPHNCDLNSYNACFKEIYHALEKIKL